MRVLSAYGFGPPPNFSFSIFTLQLKMVQDYDLKTCNDMQAQNITEYNPNRTGTCILTLLTHEIRQIGTGIEKIEEEDKTKLCGREEKLKSETIKSHQKEKKKKKETHNYDADF